MEVSYHLKMFFVNKTFFPTFALFGIHSCHNHVNDIWNKNHRNGKVSQKTVSFLDQCQKPELCDAKINQTADQCDDNLTGGDAFFWCLCPEFLLLVSHRIHYFFCRTGSCFLSPSDTRFTMAATIFYGGGYGTEDNQNGN